MNSRARSNLVKRIVKTSSRIILLSYFVTLVSIIYADELSQNRNLLFES